jgi:transcriptional regulator with XRE-family HTH domain
MHGMNAVRNIRKSVFKLSQAQFAAVACVSQPTVSRWEKGSEPSRDDMERIRSAALDRGLGWDDKWFFETPTDRVSA